MSNRVEKVISSVGLRKKIMSKYQGGDCYKYKAIYFD
jgi:hypothetical protein